MKTETENEKGKTQTKIRLYEIIEKGKLPKGKRA